METATPLALKFAFTALLAVFVLPAVGVVTVGQAVIAAAVLTAVGFIVGDRWALPRYGDAVAAVADLVLAVAVFRLVPALVPGMSVGFGGALVAGGAVTLAEILFHVYLERLSEAGRKA